MRTLRAFWERLGYACVLAVCAAMIAATAVLTRPAPEEVTPPEVTRYAAATPAPAATDVDALVQTEPERPAFLFPCDGEVGMTYAEDAAVYNQTLAQYAAHSGVDILAKEGEAVRAMEDGLVTRVWQDALMGHCMEVTHRSGYISTYCSLYSAGVVEEGAAVSRGQIIGTVGTSALAECAEGPHVHVELRRTRKALNPMEYFEEFSK